MADLKPCPFCGAHDGIGYGYARDGASLCCGSCGVGFVRYHGKGGMPEAHERLAEAWNTRATEGRAAELLKDAEKALVTACELGFDVEKHRAVGGIAPMAIGRVSYFNDVIERIREFQSGDL
ncbi:Lar family restriction alleviation protein [Ruegeria sp. HKCCD6109]|uniref:Lar family restriction alleviation protein n=1 Tax=Ruegeria sp. HKCCD6109 TaxID=2683017 RepID=UPI001492546B|nr:Lar family restriction alleviation protein [Ruegeria sp. HKCCD6109]NOD65768.1 hypothetical protein [Ruegeria sp. HKCCD6109]